MATTPNLPPGWTAVPATTTATKSQPNRAYYTTIQDPNNSGQNLKLYVTTNLQNNIIEYTYYNSKNQPIFTKRQNANIQLAPGSTLTTQQQQNLINNAYQQTNTLSNSLGGNTNNTVIGGGPATPTQTQAPIIDEKYTNFTSSNETTLFGDGAKKFLKYPEDILELQQDTLQISMYNYQAPKGDLFAGNAPIKSIYIDGIQRNSALKEYIGTVILPIPSGISDSNNVNWGEDSMNNLTAAVTANVFRQPLNTALQQGTVGLFNAVQSYFTNMNLPTTTINNIAAILSAGGFIGVNEGLKNPNVRSAVSSLLLKNAGFEVSPESILARGQGIVPNSNLELLFSGPTLRDFTFAYRMSPRSSGEATNVKRIIRFFKQGSAARKLNAKGGAGGASVFLGTPNVFKLRYITTGNKDISGVNRFKVCALRSVAVNYAPDGTWAAYDEGQPVSLTMSLNFQEIEPVYESDYQQETSKEFLTGGNNDWASDNYTPVGPNDVGY